ncbi:uncharacterized protein PGTG_04920 [Puccinia graminis f. sp. tritici CRL 75-36-700-3]|uniref:Uncharacterized protein n=1 Tax=Puccinia graminis f. sp. tritici (strain CRL 75-36-700-3 / race SCCL) TaxID=418459 RepID=E3K3A7_PUCGT|nr:uncharacterized protein PGTG_04920 [Puccinia graminis f. sp. tritici CRL 75-36-700-3]EFP78964.2 hypothetical protein PGTG_04920 [Puccinia graminis f. sp. tritici CRL 75-36-700-3]
MCDSLHNKCGVSQSSPEESLFKDCVLFSDGIKKVVNNGTMADAWNFLWGFNTNYAAQKATGEGTGGKGDGKPQIEKSGSSTSSSSPTPPSATQPPNNNSNKGAGGATQNGNTNQMGMDQNGNMQQNMNQNQPQSTDPNMSQQNMNQNQPQSTDPNMSMNQQGMNPAPAADTGPPVDPKAIVDKLLGRQIDVTKIPNKDCHDYRIEFGSGFKGREAKDVAYQPLQPIFGHGAALNMAIITRCMLPITLTSHNSAAQ